MMVHFDYYGSLDEYEKVRGDQDYEIQQYLPEREGEACKPIELSLFVSKNGVPPHLRRYLLAIMGLYAEVALSRNYLAIRGRMAETGAAKGKVAQWNGLKEFLPLTALLIIVSTNSIRYPYDVRAACTRLIQNVHLDQFPWQPISLPFRNREWSLVETRHDYLHIDQSNLFCRVGEKYTDPSKSRLKNLILSTKLFVSRYVCGFIGLD